MSKFIPSLLSLFLLILSLSGLASGLTSTLSYVFSPVTSPALSIRVSLRNTLSDMRSLPSLLRKLKDLERQNQQLTTKVQALPNLERELAVYRENKNKAFRLTPVRLISLNHQATITLSENGLVKPGQPLVSDSTLIGIVATVANHTATVSLLAEFDGSIPTTLNSLATANFTTKDQMPIITDIDNAVSLSLGDSVFTTGNEVIPPNLLIGKIRKITSIPSDPNQACIIDLSGTITSQNLAIIVDF